MAVLRVWAPVVDGEAGGVTISDSRGVWYPKRLRDGSVSRWYRDGTRGDDVVAGAVRAVQARLLVVGFAPGPLDGLFGARTAEAVTSFQRLAGLTADGVVGPATMRAFLEPVCRHAEGAYGIPGRVMSGKVAFESACDPGAVGENGFDLGPAQINLSVHEVAVVDACDLTWSVRWSAQRLRAAHADLRARVEAGGHGGRVDPWDCAILNHNWPVGARRWATDGRPPPHPRMDARVPAGAGVSTWAEFYVQRVRTSVF